jgi:hypothetical protein
MVCPFSSKTMTGFSRQLGKFPNARFGCDALRNTGDAAASKIPSIKMRGTAPSPVVSASGPKLMWTDVSCSKRSTKSGNTRNTGFRSGSGTCRSRPPIWTQPRHTSVAATSVHRIRNPFRIHGNPRVLLWLLLSRKNGVAQLLRNARRPMSQPNTVAGHLPSQSRPLQSLRPSQAPSLRRGRLLQSLSRSQASLPLLRQ